MITLPRFHPIGRPAAILALALLLPGMGKAAVLPEWSAQQTFEVPGPGLMRVSLTPQSYDLARQDLADLRVIDPGGLELSYVLETQETGYRLYHHVDNPRTQLNDRDTLLVVSVDEPTKLRAIRLETSADNFIKGVTFEVVLRNGTLKALSRRIAMFRQGGAENMTFALEGLPADTQTLRITLDDSRSRPIPIVGIGFLSEETPGQVMTPVAAKILQSVEGVGETRITVDLGSSKLPLAGLRLEVDDPVFIRRVSVLAREWVNGELRDRTLGSGVIHRVDLEDLKKTERLDFMLQTVAPGREVLIVIVNGDSPPLSVRSAGFLQLPKRIVFPARQGGPHRLFSGNPQARPPQYDLASLQGSLRKAGGGSMALGSPSPNPDYRAPENLPNIPIFGAGFDPAGWRFQRAVMIEAPGVQRLDLPPHALAETMSDRSDVRLVSEKKQILYVLDQPDGYTKPIDIALSAPEPTDKAGVMRWKLELPQPRLPVSRIRCDVTTTLFDRQLRVVEKLQDHRGEPIEASLGRARWVRTPERTNALFELRLDGTPRTRTLWLETDNRENAPLVIRSLQILVPTVQLLFQTQNTGPVELCYGNTNARSPYYDLSLVAPRIVNAPKHDARLADADPVMSHDRARVPASWIFYAVLGVVVLGLMFIITKLLPKPSTPQP